MDQTPFFSVIIPVYNLHDLIAQTLHSVLQQSFDDFEIIVIDDHSTDDTCAVVQAVIDEHSGKRIRLEKNRRGKGASGARNTGIGLAEGRWICFLDGDDLWLESHLQNRYDEIRRDDSGQLDFISSDFYLWFDASDTRKAQHSENRDWRDCFQPSHDSGATFYSRRLLDIFFDKAVIVHTNVVTLKKELVRATGYFDERFRTFEDTHYWLRLAGKSRLFAYIPDATCLYRQREGSLTKTGDSFYRDSPAIYIDLLANPDFGPYRRQLLRLLRDSIHMNTYYYRENRQPLRAIRSALQGMRHDPFSRVSLKNLLASLLAR